MKNPKLAFWTLDDNDQIQNVSVGTEGSGFRTLIQVLDKKTD